jgi:ubiquinone/menaquinone biosynthesis C-methylase UbiE
MDRRTLIQYLFDESAGRYERDITPVFAPLTADFVAYAAPRRADRALDVGTGTGLLARHLAPYVQNVVGVDIAPRVLAAARDLPTVANVHYVRADLNRLPFPAGGFTLVAASFGLNVTDPDRSLRALRRVMAPGGRFVLQEWGPVGALDRWIDELLDEYAADDPGPAVLALREALEDDPARWRSQLQDVDDYAERLGELGFAVEDAREYAPVMIRFTHKDDYLRYKLAWTYRYEEVRAMDEDRRAAFMAAARASLADMAQPDGSIVWEPVVFRVTAIREKDTPPRRGERRV